jgi:hypothetical protein
MYRQIFFTPKRVLPIASHAIACKYPPNETEDAMAYNDDTDRHCPHCGGKRFFSDTHTHDYGYTARSNTRCWDCAPAVEPDAPRKSDDDLVAEATERMIAARGITKDEYYAERAEEMGWLV